MNNKNINWGYNATKVVPGIQLAKDIVNHNKKMEEIIHNKIFKFPVWEKEGKSFVQTAICTVGGCVVSYLTFDSLSEAERHSALMTIAGEKMKQVIMCDKCINEGKYDHYCMHCGDEKSPVDDLFPNGSKFCLRCDISLN